MLNFDEFEFADWLRSCLCEILDDDEIDQSAWWKKEEKGGFTMKHYMEGDCLSVAELKAMPVGSHITGTNTYYTAIKTEADAWTFNDRVDTMYDCTSYFIANVFEDTEFDVYVKEV